MANSTLKLDYLLSKFNSLKTWNKEKRSLKSEIIKHLKTEGYLFFVGSKHIYKLTKTGDICQFKISNKQDGPLNKFRNQEIQLICLGQEHCDYMHFAAKQIT
jgi:hypothetical protein